VVSTDVWGIIHAERKALVADLQGLTAPQWAAPWLCTSWTVRDVLAHMTATARCRRRPELAQLTRSPVVELNRVVAVAQTGSTLAALQILDGLGLDDYRYLHSARAELLRRLGRGDEARAAYRRALGLTRTEAERRFLHRRLAEL